MTETLEHARNLQRLLQGWGLSADTYAEDDVQPLLDSLFDDHSNGFRPGRGREHAVAQAMTVSRQQGH